MLSSISALPAAAAIALIPIAGSAQAQIARQRVTVDIAMAADLCGRGLVSVLHSFGPRANLRRRS